MLTISQWSFARAFPPVSSKTKSFTPYTEIECIECNCETWQASRLIYYLFIGVYFIPCDCYCDYIYDVQITYVQDRSC